MTSNSSNPSKLPESGLRLIAGEWRLLLFGMLMTCWSAPGQTFFIALFSDPIRESMALSYASFGGLYSAATLLSALVVLWSGGLVDRIAIPRFACFVVIALAASMLLLTMSTHIALLFISLFLLRHFGQSLMMLTASTTMLRYLPSLAGRATAISGLGYVFGEAAFPILVVSMITLLGWTGSLQFLAVFFVITMLPAILILLRDYKARHQSYLEKLEMQKSSFATQAAENTDNPGSTLREWTRADVLRDSRFYLLLPAILAQSLLFTGFIFHQNFILETRDWALSWWASLFGMYAFIAVICKILAGIAIDVWGAIRILPYSPLPLAISLLVLANSDSDSAAVLFFIGLGITSGIQTTLGGPIWLSLYGSRHLGAIKSLASSFIVLGTAITPFLMGLLIDNGISLSQLCYGAVIYIVFSIALVFISQNLKDQSRRPEH